MRLTAIIPATDAPSTLERCVTAIRSAEEAPEEVIVIDAAPGPGPAAARNAGALRATGDVLVFVDADVLPHADAFRRIRAAFAGDPNLTAVFGSYDDAPEARGAVSGFRNLLHHHVHQDGAGPASTFWAGLGAIRRDSFAEVDGFDAHRFVESSIEDVELGVRLTAAGAQIRLDPTVQGTHLKRWSLAKMIQTDFSRRGVPWVALLAREAVVPATLNLGWRHRLSAGASVLLAVSLARRNTRAAATATGALLVLNASFYRLLLKQRGPRHAAIGVGLHVLHHLVTVAALPAGLAAHVHERRSSDTGERSR